MPTRHATAHTTTNRNTDCVELHVRTGTTSRVLAPLDPEEAHELALDLFTAYYELRPAR